MLVREIETKDTSRVVDLFKSLDTETEFMLFEPNERNYNLEHNKDLINSYIESPTKTMFISENNREITGFIIGIGGLYKRNRHNLYIVIGIKQEFTGQNLGKVFFELLEKWAIKNSYNRLELTVMSHNERAIKLYKSLGYIEEGIKHNSIKLSSGYVNEICMYKII